jgi:predicted ester cyclase
MLVEDAISEGDKVAVRVTQQGTHQGVFQGVNGTGTRVNVSAIAFFRVANGRVVEEWLSSDRLGLLQQIGAIPAPSSR